MTVCVVRFIQIGAAISIEIQQVAELTSETVIVLARSGECLLKTCSRLLKPVLRDLQANVFRAPTQTPRFSACYLHLSEQ